MRATGVDGFSLERSFPIDLIDVNDPATIAAPAITRVVRGRTSPIVWPAGTVPVSDADLLPATLSVRLSVDEGTLAAETEAGVTVDGTARERVFTGTAKALNDYFQSLGSITYRSADAGSTEIGLDVFVLDEGLAAEATADILVAELIQRPQLRRATTIRLDASLVGPQPIVLTHADLAAAAITDPGSTALVVTSIASGRVEKWHDGRWVDITKPATGSPQELLRQLALRVIRPGDQVRWVPATKPGRLTNAFALLGWDGTSMSDDDSDVIVELPSA